MQVIEFLGVPRSGKSTQAELLRRALEARGQDVLLLSDRSRMAAMAVPPQESLAFALCFYGQLLDAYYRYKDRADVLLVDRGFNDAAVWADVYRAMKVVNDAERRALIDAFGRFARLPGAVLLFMAPLDAVIQRHRATLHEGVDDVAMNRDWLEALEAAYLARRPQFTNCLVVDGTRPVDETHEAITTFLKGTRAV